MATGTETVDQVADATSLPRVTVGTIAKILKQHKPTPLFARSGQGGGKSAGHVTPFELTNLALALSVSPLSEGPEMVLWMRGLVPTKSGASEAFLPGDTLGDALDVMIDTCSAARGFSRLAAEVRLPSIKITRYGARPPIIYMEARGQDEMRHSFERFCAYVPAPENADRASALLPAAAPTTTFTIPFAFVSILSELWADTRRQKGLPLLNPT